MKLTKSVLMRLIKEEISRMNEAYEGTHHLDRSDMEYWDMLGYIRDSVRRSIDRKDFEEARATVEDRLKGFDRDRNDFLEMIKKAEAAAKGTPAPPEPPAPPAQKPPVPDRIPYTESRRRRVLPRRK